MSKILIVEDDKQVGAVLWDVLKSQNYLSDWALTLADAKYFLKISAYDLILLDWELPDGSGMELCRDLRNQANHVPVLMLTGRTSINDRTTGLDTGADDYLVKPFELPELLARIRSLLRRLWRDRQEKLKFGSLEMDIQTRQVFKQGAELKLLRKEFDLLELLMRHQSTFFSTEMLLQRLWGADTEAGADAVFQCVRRLRRKIDQIDSDSLVYLEHGQGYCLRKTQAEKKE